MPQRGTLIASLTIGVGNTESDVVPLGAVAQGKIGLVVPAGLTGTEVAVQVGDSGSGFHPHYNGAPPVAITIPADGALSFGFFPFTSVRVVSDAGQAGAEAVIEVWAIDG